MKFFFKHWALFAVLLAAWWVYRRWFAQPSSTTSLLNNAVNPYSAGDRNLQKPNF